MLSTQEIEKYRQMYGSEVDIILNSGGSLEQIRKYIIEGEEFGDDLTRILLSRIKDKGNHEGLLDYLEHREGLDRRKMRFDEENRTNTITGVTRREVIVCEDSSSAWQHYRSHLERQRFENIDEIQSASRNILEMLSPETEQGFPVKGSVIGNIQSGKTANMEALMSMACDNGWNFFIILSGTINSLREQTEDRMLKDLRRRGEDDPLRYEWERILPKESRKDFDYHMFDFGEGSNKRYLSVILKNVTHLRQLIRNLQRLQNIDRVNLVVIDDEADLASVNTGKEYRTRINQLIINLIEGKDDKGKPTPKTFHSVNYICYTATPYAVLLNESEGLYPSDFITALTPSRRYIGLDRMFGSDRYEGMNVIRVRNDIDTDFRSLIGHPENMPNSMKECIAWFVCCVAVLRYWGDYKQPVSLLMNVDPKIDNHRIVDETVVDYLVNQRDDLLKRCETVYDDRKNFTAENFRSSVWDYGTVDDSDPYPDIRELPSYEVIEDFVRDIVNSDPTRIKMDDEGYPVFDPRSIHVCVDNCRELSPAISDEENYRCRLFYPEDEDPVLNNVPAFIVIGGNTLSRGLTIKGLVATYFRRVQVKQADNLLQMARWFGFRDGYELLPRVWMDSKAKSAYEDLSKINEALLREISVMNSEGVTPRDYHVRIMNVPEAHMLRSLTAANKSRGAVTTWHPDFSGQEKAFHDYPKDESILELNMEYTESFLGSISEYEAESGSGGHMFRGVPKDLVLAYMKSFNRISKRYASSPDSSIRWLSRADMDSFNVFLTGNKEPSEGCADSPVASFIGGKYAVNKVVRNSDPDKDNVHIKTVRDKKDLIADIPQEVIDGFSEKDRRELLTGDIRVRNAAREKAGLGRTPLLVVYVARCLNIELDNVVLLSWLIPKGVQSDPTFVDDTEYVFLEDGI